MTTMLASDWWTGFRTWKGRLLEELLGPVTLVLAQDQEAGRLDR